MLGLHHQLAAAVEQRGRAVAALLDVRRVRGADQHRAHLVAGGAQRADQDLERDRVEARRSSSPLGDDRARVVDLGAPARAAAPGSPPAARTRTAPRPRRPSPGSPRRTSASSHSPPKRARRPARSSSSLGGRRGRDLGPGLDQRQADRHQLDLGLGVAVAVAALVLGGEALGELGGVGLSAPRDRQLERLAAVAQLVDDLGPASLEALGEPLAQRRDLGRDPLRGQLVAARASPCGRCRGGARRRAGRAPRARRSRAGRGSARSRARRRSPPRASARRRRTASARIRAGRRRARP